MDRPASAVPSSLTLTLEPSRDDGPRWVVARAEAEAEAEIVAVRAGGARITRELVR
jgi:hypothetical protein